MRHRTFNTLLVCWLCAAALYPASATEAEKRRNDGENRTEAADTACFKVPGRLSVKTNLLYDIAAVPSIGIEYEFAKNWSIAGDWDYIWLRNDRKYFCWRTYGGSLGIRKYFGKREKKTVLSGHHLGLYGQALTYDFLLGDDGVLSRYWPYRLAQSHFSDRFESAGLLGRDWHYGGGIEYGYACRIGKCAKLDFSIGGGYIRGQYYLYQILDDLSVRQEGPTPLSYFGLTKAEISLVLTFRQKRKYY